MSDINKNGHYKSAGGLNLPPTQRYHLRVKTNNSEYLSDFESIKVTPPIDSVGFVVQNNGVQLYLNTHDPNNNTHYYRWEYVETWNFRALYQSFYVTDGTQLNFRKPSQQVYNCFQSDSSSTVLLGSSAKLTSDIIYQSPLTQVASTSEKIETKYSILVSQYALTPGAYSFWQVLKTNTEQLGTIFSSMPSGLTGNIHCITNPSEPVLGYISVCNVQQKRIFITSAQLPHAWNPVYPYNCEIDTISLKSITGVIQLGSTELILEPYTAPNSETVLGYLGANQYCADCTLRGTTAIPAFWQ